MCATCARFISDLMCATSMPIRCNKRDAETSSGSESLSFSTHAFLSTNHLAKFVSHVVCLLWWLHVSFQRVASLGSHATPSLLFCFHRPVVHHFINVLMHIVVLVELVLDGPLDCIPHRRHRQVRRRGVVQFCPSLPRVTSRSGSVLLHCLVPLSSGIEKSFVALYVLRFGTY